MFWVIFHPKIVFFFNDGGIREVLDPAGLARDFLPSSLNITFGSYWLIVNMILIVPVFVCVSSKKKKESAIDCCLSGHVKFMILVCLCVR